jgi:ubiquinone/menaquinone biosynthesis C-methylase UbiE
MEHLPWEDGSFDVVTGFNSFQYALDVHTALAEACRVARPGGQLAVCKYDRPADVDGAIQGLGLRVVGSGQVPSVMTLADDEALTAALASAGSVSEPAGVLAAAAPYRQPDGGYRFENRLKYSLIAA